MLGAQCRFPSLRLDALLMDTGVLGGAVWGYLDRLCEGLPQMGVLVLSAPGPVAERVRGLRLGADDWITKPCHADELLARVEAVVRRRHGVEIRADAAPVVVGELEVRAGQFQAFVHGRSADLTRREFELILLLAESAGQVMPREEIYERVWGYAMIRGDRSVDVFIRKLRLKLKRVSPGWLYIHTHYGIGYRFSPEETETPVEEPVPALAV